MSFSEYLVTFYAIIIGLIVSNFFFGWADMIKNRSTSNFYWAHILLTVVLLLTMIREFWIAYKHFSITLHSISGFLKVLVSPVIYFFSSILLFPGRSEKQLPINYKEFFYSKVYDLTFLFGLTFVIDMIGVIYRNGFAEVMVAVNATGILCCFLIIKYKRQRVIEAVVIIATLMIGFLLYEIW